MKTKKMVSVLILFIVLAIVVSCKDSADSAVTRLEIAIEDRSMDSRTIMPSGALMEVRKYSVSGQGPSGQTFGPIVSTESSITISDILVGSWNIQAKAMNAENKELASGSGTYSIGRGQSSITVALDSFTGTGTLQLDISWDSDITVHEKVRLDVSVSDTSGNVISTVSKESNTDSEGVSVLMPLAAGCHVMTVRAFDSDGSLDVGATDAVRIVEGTKTQGSIHLKPSGMAMLGALAFALDNQIGVPMSFYIDYSPKNITSGSTVVLSALHGELDPAISESSLHYSWYRDGVQLSVADSSTCSIQALVGLHRYDVIVRSNVEGTMCGASLLLNVAE